MLTIPIFYPVVMGLDFYGMTPVDKSIWFGILALMVVELRIVLLLLVPAISLWLVHLKA